MWISKLSQSFRKHVFASAHSLTVAVPMGGTGEPPCVSMWTDGKHALTNSRGQLTGEPSLSFRYYKSPQAYARGYSPVREGGDFAIL
jgi:hypothetical protein